MGGKYEIRYQDKDDDLKGYTTVYTNSWIEFIWLRMTENIIYYKVYCTRR